MERILHAHTRTPLTSADDLLRLTSSVRKGTVTASLILGKLASYPRQNGLAHALREVGRIEKSLFALEWLQSYEIERELNSADIILPLISPHFMDSDYCSSKESSDPITRISVLDQI